MRYFQQALNFVGGAALFFTIIACTNPEGKSKELYETAQFEEQQNNLKHARQLYKEIITDYPESSLVSQAKERLEALRDKDSP